MNFLLFSTPVPDTAVATSSGRCGDGRSLVNDKTPACGADRARAGKTPFVLQPYQRAYFENPGRLRLFIR